MEGIDTYMKFAKEKIYWDESKQNKAELQKKGNKREFSLRIERNRKRK